MTGYALPIRRTRVAGVALFTVLTVCGVLGAPTYIFYYGIGAAELSLFVFYFLATGLSITMGYHRLFAHTTFKTNRIIRFLLLFFGAATFEQSALKWASQHRQHHQFTDTDYDPHNSKRGFWYTHIGWILFYKHRVNQDNVKDLLKDSMLMHQHKYYNLWAVGSGIFLPMLIGYWIEKPLSVFLTVVCLRMFLVLNAAFFINSYAHMIGKNTYNRSESARDHWLGALITNGEGYHSYHHRFPNDYRNGYLWHHWDPSKWIIYFLFCLGLTWDLKRSDSRDVAKFIR